jgi:hypothetical protein
MTRHRFAWLALGAMFLSPRVAPANEVYYMIVLGSQRPVFFEANHTPSFVVFGPTLRRD